MDIKTPKIYFYKHLGKTDCSLHTWLNPILRKKTCATLLIHSVLVKCLYVWDLRTSCQQSSELWSHVLVCHEDRGVTFLRNFCNHLQESIVSQSRRPLSASVFYCQCFHIFSPKSAMIVSNMATCARSESQRSQNHYDYTYKTDTRTAFTQ